MKLINVLLITITSLIAFILGIYLYISNSTSSQIFDHSYEFPAYNIALVLGTGKNQTFAPENFAFTGRMKATKKLYKEHQHLEKIIVSGLKNNVNYNEAFEMKMHLSKMGVDSSIIKMDEEGSRTFNSILHAKNNYKFDGIIMVSQKEHLQRALFISNALEMNCVGLEAKEIPNRNSIKLLSRELFARLKCVFDIVEYRLNRNERK